MSQEFNVFLNRKDIPSAADWRAAIRRANPDLEFDANFDPVTFSGFLPCKVGGVPGGFEYWFGSQTDVITVYPDLSPVVSHFDSVVSLVFAGNLSECIAAGFAAATLTSLCHGIMYDPQADLRFSGPDAIDYAHELQRQSSS